MFYPLLLLYFTPFHLSLHPLPPLPLTELFHPPFHSVGHVRLPLIHTRTHSSMHTHSHTHTTRARTHICSKIDVTRRGESGKYIDTRTSTPDVHWLGSYLCAPVSLSRHAHHWANIRLTKQGKLPTPPLPLVIHVSMYRVPCLYRGVTLVTHRKASIATRPMFLRTLVCSCSGDNWRASPEIYHRRVFSLFFFFSTTFHPFSVHSPLLGARFVIHVNSHRWTSSRMNDNWQIWRSSNVIVQLEIK